MGVVTTNALAYANSAPTFENGRLKYSVAGMHYDDAGEVIRGTYDLVLRSDAARCLYGFTDAPINAVVSVTYGDREQSVSTSVVGERNGWLYISAKNFTFSNPTIEVVISQPKGTPTSMVTSTTSRSNVNSKKEAESTKKVTITCIKGKVTKKFTGASPKCPEGFKRRG
jgi:hypothetical protein